jgi:hypothetical protein
MNEAPYIFYPYRAVQDVPYLVVSSYEFIGSADDIVRTATYSSVNAVRYTQNDDGTYTYCKVYTFTDLEEACTLAQDLYATLYTPDAEIQYRPLPLTSTLP